MKFYLSNFTVLGRLRNTGLEVLKFSRDQFERSWTARLSQNCDNCNNAKLPTQKGTNKCKGTEHSDDTIYNIPINSIEKLVTWISKQTTFSLGDDV